MVHTKDKLNPIWAQVMFFKSKWKWNEKIIPRYDDKNSKKKEERRGNIYKKKTKGDRIEKEAQAKPCHTLQVEEVESY